MRPASHNFFEDLICDQQIIDGRTCCFNPDQIYWIILQSRPLDKWTCEAWDRPYDPDLSATGLIPWLVKYLPSALGWPMGGNGLLHLLNATQ
jgi:hypothetical protein